MDRPFLQFPMKRGRLFQFGHIPGADLLGFADGRLGINIGCAENGKQKACGGDLFHGDDRFRRERLCVWLAAQSLKRAGECVWPYGIDEKGRVQRVAG